MSVATVATEVKVGDIFYSSWGYDQTNVSFFEVVGITPSGKSVKVRKVANVRVGGSGYSDSVVPAKGHYTGAVQTKRLRDAWGGGKAIHLTSYADGYQWDGRPCEQTAAGYGH